MRPEALDTGRKLPPLRHSAAFHTSLAFLASGVVCLLLVDLEVSTLEPWGELGRMAWGLLTPSLSGVEAVGNALLMTVAFAFAGVAAGALVGFALALVFDWAIVRGVSAFVRAIHELFWALILLQVLGLTPLTGLLAIAIPYAGTFAKVYAEIMEEADPAPLRGLPAGSGRLSSFFFARLPPVWAHLKSYTSYRLECGLRSSAVLGFVGLPTIGYHLETYFSQGSYSQAAALLLLFYALIASLRLWVRPRLVGVYLVAALVFTVRWPPGGWDNVVRFFTVDIVAEPLRAGLRDGNLLHPDTLLRLGEWHWRLLESQVLPGAWSTLLLAQVALVATGLLTLLAFPLVSRHFMGRFGRAVGHLLLVVTRSTPEYILAYLFLQLWGPSMLPAIVALALHNGAILAHLTGRHADTIELRQDAPRGLSRYGYEVLPRVYGQFLAFLFYRWEVILRETAILGILGVYTLGFHVDSAISDIRLDRALFLILCTALLNMFVDSFSRRLRAGLRLATTADVA